MAKKQKTEKVEVPVVETPVVETIKPEKIKTVKPTWEIKDRVYYLKSNLKPLSKMIRSSDIFWFDEEKGYQRELKYCQNQQTCFVDEMKGYQRLSHIVFRNGALFVEKEKTVLQKLLSLYHPFRDRLFEEHKPSEIASNEIDILNMEVDALTAARNVDIDMAEAIMRAEIGSKVSEMSSKELRRDLLIFAKNNPSLFLDLVNDENIVLRNFGIRATEMGILKLSPDQ